MKEVTINGATYGLEYNLRSLFIYEEIAGHPYKGDKTIDNYMLMYAMLQANNKDFSLSFDGSVPGYKLQSLIFCENPGEPFLCQ